MNLSEAIESRNAVRTYADCVVDESIVESLLRAAFPAPGAMNEQPLVFAVIQDAARLERLSDRAKAMLLAVARPKAAAHANVARLADPRFNIFCNAPTLIVVGAREAGPYAETDCWLAAENLILAARDRGLAPCAIRSAVAVLNTSDVKSELAFPSSAIVVAPIIVGYASKPRNPCLTRGQR